MDEVVELRQEVQALRDALEAMRSAFESDPGLKLIQIAHLTHTERLGRFQSFLYCTVRLHEQCRL